VRTPPVTGKGPKSIATRTAKIPSLLSTRQRQTDLLILLILVEWPGNRRRYTSGLGLGALPSEIFMVEECGNRCGQCLSNCAAKASAFSRVVSVVNLRPKAYQERGNIPPLNRM
jgi:hypothetical protein